MGAADTTRLDHLAPPTVAQPGVDARVSALDRWLAAQLQRAIAPAAVRLELWNGSSPFQSTHRPTGDLIIGDRRTLLGLIFNPDLWFGEAYMAGRLDVRGPLEPVIEALSRLPSPTWRERIRLLLARPSSLSAARDNVHPHYEPRERLLCTVARPRDALHVRLLRAVRYVSRGGATREDGPDLP